MRGFMTVDAPGRKDLLDVLYAARAEALAEAVELVEARWWQPIFLSWMIHELLRRLLTRRRG
jgi:hypothetical protein